MWADAFGAAWVFYVTVAITAVIVGLCYAALGAVLIVIVPSWRTMVEGLAVLVFLTHFLNPFLPDVIHAYGADFLVSVVIGIVIFNIAYGTALDRFRIWLDHAETRRFTLAGTPESIWDWLVPGQARTDPERNWEPLLNRIEARAGDPSAFDVEYRLGHAIFEHQTIRYDRVTWPTSAHYTFEGEANPANRNLVSGTMGFLIEPVSGTDKCRVTLTRTRKSLLVREGLLMWFDDALADQADHMRAASTGRSDWSMAGRFRREAVSLS